MNASRIILLVAGIIAAQALMWVIIYFYVRKRTDELKRSIADQYLGTKDRFVIGPQSALYRGADARFGNVKGNGIIYLTENTLYFEKLTGHKMGLDRTEIVEVTVENSFKGKTSFATGGKHLVIKTKDGNRIGFLLKNAGEWAQKINFEHLPVV